MLRRFESNALFWMESNGGPLLLVPGEHLPLWEGIDTPAPGRHIIAKFRWSEADAPATDYDRACDVDDYLGLIEIGTGKGLVLGDEPLATAWWPGYSDVVATDSDASFANNIADHHNGVVEAAPGGTLVRWVYADSEWDVVESLQHIPDDIWTADQVSIQVQDEPLYLIDAGYSGSKLEGDDHLVIKLPGGRYSIHTAHYKPNENTALLLHRLFRADFTST